MRGCEEDVEREERTDGGEHDGEVHTGEPPCDMRGAVIERTDQPP
jgi:hypothetical protein